MLNLAPPDKKKGDVCSCVISMTILPKAEADGKPVGEAWDEPNEDPKLSPPQEGRGFKAAMDGMLIDTSKIGLPSFNFMRKYLIAGALASVMGILMVVVMKFA
jgi:hypothetical protein